MRPPLAQYESEEFASRWHSNETLASMSKWLGVSITAVYNAAMRRGLPKRLEMRAQHDTPEARMAATLRRLTEGGARQ